MLRSLVNPSHDLRVKAQDGQLAAVVERVADPERVGEGMRLGEGGHGRRVPDPACNATISWAPCNSAANLLLDAGEVPEPLGRRQLRF